MTITIGLTGDVMIGRLVEKMLQRVLPDYIWGDTLSLFKSQDFTLINLEAALTTCNKKVEKVFNFKADPSRIEVLKRANISCVTLANNHVLDYGTDGLLETLDVLDRGQVPHVGAGRNAEEAKKPQIFQVKDVRIGCLGITDNEPTWKATDSSPGIHYVPINDRGLNSVAKEIKKLKETVDLVILTAHWGPNMRQRPSKLFQEFARKAVDAGADIYHGHSAHLFQGVEIYKNKVIFYDTGDFVDDYAVDPSLRNDHSFFFTVRVSKKKIVSLHLFPTSIGNCQVNLSKGSEKQEIMEKMQSLSEGGFHIFGHFTLDSSSLFPT